MSPLHRWQSPLWAVSVEHLVLLLCSSLLVLFLCAHPRQPDGVSIPPSRAASHGGVCELPLLYPSTKIICISPLILPRVYKTPSFLNSLFILHGISLADPLSLLKPLSLQSTVFTLLLFPLPFLTSADTCFGLSCHWYFAPSWFFLFFPCWWESNVEEPPPSFVPVSSFTIFFSVPGCAWCLPFLENVWAVKGP